MNEPKAGTSPPDDHSGRAPQAGRALQEAALALIQVIAWIALQALRSALLLAVPLLKLGCVALAGYGMVELYPVVFRLYGADLPAAILALAAVLIVPAFLLARAGASLGGLALAGIVELGARAMLSHMPPAALALAPGLALAACVLQLAFTAHASRIPKARLYIKLESVLGAQRRVTMHLDHKSEGSGSVLLWIITTALLVFTAARSVHLIQSTLPEDSKVLAYAALAGLDGGVLAWLFWTTRSARGATQHTIGTLMIIVDLAGITAAVLGDTMLVADPTNRAIVATVAIWLVPLVIVSNVVATVVAHLVDPAQAIRDAQRSLRDELDRQMAEAMARNAASTAADAAAIAAQHWAEQTKAAYMAGLQPKGKSAPPAKRASATYASGTNVPEAKIVPARKPRKPRGQS